MDADLDTLATALYVSTDDLLKARPELAPLRPRVGIVPKLSDAELITLAVMQALLGFTSEARWLRHAKTHLSQQFPYLPGQSGYNKRLRAAAVPAQGRDPTPGHQHRHLHRRRVGGRLHPRRVRTIQGNRKTIRSGRVRRIRVLRVPLPVLLGSAPTSGVHPGRSAGHLRVDQPQGRRTGSAARACSKSNPISSPTDPRQTVIGDKNYFGHEFEARLHESTVRLLRPTRKGEPERAGSGSVQTTSAGHRVHQRHPQGPTQPRTPRRTHHRRSHRPRPPTHPRADRSDLAQPPHPTAGPTITDRIRPLTPRNYSSRRC